MLLSRVGQKKQRLWPWFEAPAAGQPMRYDGWFWDPRNKEWLPTEMVPMTISVSVPDVPMPITMPSRTQPARVPGWEYDFNQNEWMHVVVAEKLIEFTPPRSLPPDVNLASVFPADPYFEMSVETARRLVETGRWDILQQGDAYFKLVAEVHRLCPAAKSPHLIAEGIFESRAIMHAKKVWLSSQEAWQMRINALEPSKYQGVTELGILAVIGLVAAGIGYLIGTILERITFPEEERFVLEEQAGTYLMRYDHYLYSKMVALTRTGKPYYSACEDIGTSWIRHRRAPIGSKIDIIDFPGGFVEEGHVGAYFVKYTWSHWLLEYIGFLTNVGGNYYVMREGNKDHQASGKAPFTLASSQWCTGFHWYL